MTKQIIGYIIINEYFGEALELTPDEEAGTPYPILLRGDFVSLFETTEAANEAIKKTVAWFKLRQEQDETLQPLEWAEEHCYAVWPVIAA